MVSFYAVILHFIYEGAWASFYMLMDHLHFFGSELSLDILHPFFYLNFYISYYFSRPLHILRLKIIGVTYYVCFLVYHLPFEIGS